MIRKLFSIIALLPCCLLFFPVSANSQQLGVVDEATAGNFFGVGARALGMGGAHIAVANDATALVYNPAGLARVKRIEFSGGLTHQRLRNKSGDLNVSYIQLESPGVNFNDGRLQSNTRLSSATIVYPVPTYRGSLVLAFGVNRIKSFDKAMKFTFAQDGSGGVESESGGLYMWSFGAAVDISPNVSVGGALNFFSGTDNYSWLYESGNGDVHGYYYKYDDTIKDRYSGFNLKLGIRVQPNRYLVIGGTIDSPVTYTIDEDWTQTTDTVFYQPEDWVHYYDYDSPEYEISLPFSLGLGIALNFNNLLLAGDLHYTDWTQMEYKRLWDMAEANRNIKDSYTDVIRWHVGAEYLFPGTGTRVRAGYYQNPLPYNSTWIKKDRNYFTSGIGFLIDQVMTLDLAWVYGSWELNDFDIELAEKYTTNQVFLTTAYHF
ncbi:MAG: outer membrane protein transport protein [candidate division Zixibacteria bacterium]|nr:outer membrane protein transport protein [candidate division Zixibacteria bacterium]